MYARRTSRKPQRSAATASFAAPIAGWVENRNLAWPLQQGQQQGAAVLDNFFPTATTAILRRGKVKYATLGAGSEPVVSMFSYVNGLDRKLFAANQSAIYDITAPPSPDNYEIVTDTDALIVTESGDWFGMSGTDNLLVWGAGGDWVVVQFATTGGIYLVGVNGSDTGFIYDGSSFWPSVAGGIWQLDIDNVSGTFETGETITGGTSGETATIYAVDGNRLLLTGVSDAFTDDEVITGGTSGATADVNSVDGGFVLVPGVAFSGGLTTADMSYVWVYKNRIYFAQKDSLSIWYLDVDSIGGDATEYPLGGIYGRGGSVLWGATWSLEAGDQGGLSEQNIIVSSEGEVAVFQGLSPEDVQTWTKTGVYRIGRPLGKKAHFRGGGDIAVATSVGLVPLSKAVSLDVTALSPATVSFSILDAWQDAVTQRGFDEWQCEIWPEGKMAIISPANPNQATPVLFVTNSETGAWCRFTGWDARAIEIFEGKLFFGSADGCVYEGNVTGADDGDVYTGTYIPLFSDLGAPASAKIPHLGRATVRAAATINAALTARFDFDVSPLPPPDAVVVTGGAVWGAAIWGQATWGAASPEVVSANWQSLGGIGSVSALELMISSGTTAPLDAEIIRLDMTYSTAEVVT